MVEETYESWIEESEKNVVKLKEQLNELQLLSEDIQSLKDDVSELPRRFSNWYSQFVEINKQYRAVFEKSNSKYVEANNEMFNTQLGNFNDKLSKEISRQDELISGAIGKIETAKDELSDTQSNLTAEVNRLSSIDLENHFKRHRETLVDIKGSINEVNKQLNGVQEKILDIKELVNNQFRAQNTKLEGIVSQISDGFNSQVEKFSLFHQEYRESISANNENHKRTRKLLYLLGGVFLLMTITIVVLMLRQ